VKRLLNKIRNNKKAVSFYKEVLDICAASFSVFDAVFLVVLRTDSDYYFRKRLDRLIFESEMQCAFLSVETERFKQNMVHSLYEVHVLNS
jgi:hypothetical protein